MTFTTSTYSVNIFCNGVFFMISPVIQKLKGKNKVYIYILLSIIGVSLAVSLIFTIAILSNKKIYKGIYIEDVHVGKMTYSEGCHLLNSIYTDKIGEIEITLTNNDFSKKFNLSEFDVVYNVEDAVKKAYDIGRTGNIFKRIKDISNVSKNGIVIDLEFSFNEKKLMDSIEDFYKNSLIEVENPDIIIEENKVYFYTGKPGTALDKDKVFDYIQNSIKTASNKPFEVPVKKIYPDDANVDDMYNKVIRQSKNAGAKVENNEVVIVPHVTGIEIDKSELSDIIENLKNEYDVKRELPVTFIEPEIKTENVEDYLFRDVLASYTSYFSTDSQNNANRAVNIRLSSSVINGTLLGPGEIFSFNDVVGPRTSDRGYLSANVYINGKIVPDVGGGICQVSSTLYNAVLFSGLETVYRMNHMFTVGYVPYGQDAAVSYNELDFKFKNNTNWPIKINAYVTNSSVKFEIVGTNEYPERKIEIVNVQVSSTPAPVKYIDDPNMPEGTSVVIQSGKPGYVYDTYKVVKVNGVETERILLHRSRYSPYQHIVKRGTKVVENKVLENTEGEGLIDSSEIIELPEDSIPAVY